MQQPLRDLTDKFNSLENIVESGNDKKIPNLAIQIVKYTELKSQRFRFKDIVNISED